MPTLEEYKNRLADFLRLNPGSAIEEIELGDTKHIAVVNPWCDDTFAISIDGEDDQIIDVLNKVYLPERLSAILHSDKDALEFIWTVFPVKGEIKNRQFNFSFEGVEYDCRFAEASQQLSMIADNTKFLKPSDADHRNLGQFGFVRSLDPEDRTEFEARSFWVKPIKWDEDAALNLINHLNFYMSYYDMGSPLVALHTPKNEFRLFKPRSRYIDGQFPPQIDGRKLDENFFIFGALLWMATLQEGFSTIIGS